MDLYYLLMTFKNTTYHFLLRQQQTATSLPICRGKLTQTTDGGLVKDFSFSSILFFPVAPEEAAAEDLSLSLLTLPRGEMIGIWPWCMPETGDEQRLNLGS